MDGDHMKKSAGILIYKREKNHLKVLLCHPGGPFWKTAKEHCWGIPKGEIDSGERVIDAAVREFKEETNIDVDGSDLVFLASKKVSNHKLVIIFQKEAYYDLKDCKSNTFQLRYPADSGELKEYPENDKFAYFDIEEAKKMIFVQQVVFLERLEKRLSEK